ncbi:DMT family transporter [Congregibacter variabilis]|uniref:DMT family transporter n=1 Tax=Congregibacter variabilis TaxID=3081200 RepID=A0ABZ0HXQ1_9GAMM|nr:DMT family transporter [Congregibacter sp. IMCC43200]
MQTAFLYAVTVVIWGTSWFAIKYQLGPVDPLVSIAHRMALAAAFCAVLTVLTQGFVRVSLRNHLRIFFQALCLFSCNYLFIYAATMDLSSGLIAVIFSTMVALNALGGALFLKMPLRLPVIVGGLMGLLGMAALFYPELETLSWSDPRLRALSLCFMGTLCASAGNLVAAGSLRRGLPVLTCNSWGMFYGACTLYVAALFLNIPITVELQRDYLLSLVYLAFFATVLAFWAYISLIGRIGPDRAAYTTLLFPIVALLVSSVLEGYLWTLWSAAGLSLVLAGNWLAMRGARS